MKAGDKVLVLTKKGKKEEEYEAVFDEIEKVAGKKVTTKKSKEDFDEKGKKAGSDSFVVDLPHYIDKAMKNSQFLKFAKTIGFAKLSKKITKAMKEKMK